ncbi:MAG TPA: IclR family transcriptional regulator [Dehalococcoidia bacterium]|nr:IclR family transcriptional regulator [Dehalococcoidia bacterium]
MSSSARRILEVIDLISRQPNGVSVTELANLLNITKAPASRMLAGYVDAGLLERDADQRHRLGMRLWSLGARALQNFRPAEIAQPVLLETAKSSGCLILMATVRGSSVFYISHVAPASPVVLLNDAVLPIHACGPGKAILAFSSAETIDSILSQPLQRFTENTITDRDAFETELAEIRQQGYALNRGELEDQVMGIAVPVFDHTGKPVLSIGSVCPEEEFGEAYVGRMAPALKEAAMTLSATLGYIPAALKVG